MSELRSFELNCPLPISRHKRILLGHGSGGRLTADLIQGTFLPAFRNDVLAALEDQATLSISGLHEGSGQRLTFSTDAFVVRPLFFPGGDIGRLAIHGTVNDLAVGGARPLFLSAAFILEEGLPLNDLERIVASMRAACDEAGVALVAGDTKVVDRGKGDQVFITTCGIGLVPAGRRLSIHAARPGDRVLVSGTIGDHGIAIMSVREGIEFETALESDTASLVDLTRVILENCPTVHEGCDRGGRYEQAEFAAEYGSPLCIVKLGCWGPVVQCNVGKRGWMNGIGGCPSVGGPCIGCTMPGFPDKFMPFMDEPPGAKLSTSAVSLYGNTVRALRGFTQASMNREPVWRHPDAGPGPAGVP